MIKCDCPSLVAASVFGAVFLFSFINYPPFNAVKRCGDQSDCFEQIIDILVHFQFRGKMTKEEYDNWRYTYPKVEIDRTKKRLRDRRKKNDE